jgi:hypothetical protein
MNLKLTVLKSLGRNAIRLTGLAAIVVSVLGAGAATQERDTIGTASQERDTIDLVA